MASDLALKYLFFFGRKVSLSEKVTRLQLYKHQSLSDSFKVILKLKTKLNPHSYSIAEGLNDSPASLTSPLHPCG